MLGISQAELSARTAISRTNLNHIENGSDPRRSTLLAIQHALEAAGVEFIGDDCVRLRRRKSEGSMTAEQFDFLMKRFKSGDFPHLSEALAKCLTGRLPQKLELQWNDSEASLLSDGKEIGRVELNAGKLAFTPDLPNENLSAVDIDRLWYWVLEGWSLHNSVAVPKIERALRGGHGQPKSRYSMRRRHRPDASGMRDQSIGVDGEQGGRDQP
jgi:transcriptional regulator with XRE-family HTH domain